MTLQRRTPPAKAKVLVKDNYFEPRSTEVARGWPGRLEWSGRTATHPLHEGAGGRVAQGREDPHRGHWKRTFRKPGMYRYVCTHWAGMRGTVTVRPAEAQARRPEAL